MKATYPAAMSQCKTLKLNDVCSLGDVDRIGNELINGPDNGMTVRPTGFDRALTGIARRVVKTKAVTAKCTRTDPVYAATTPAH